MAGLRHPLYPDVLGCFGSEQLETTQRDSGPSREGSMGMIGFDITCESAGSGPRMQGYLVNDLCKTIIADANRNEFALAA
jgi:hypothetical protein